MKIWNTHQSRAKLAYEEAGTGPTLVLLHAFPFARTMYANQLQALSGQFRVLTPDLFGFGGSSVVESWSVDQQADTLAEWLESVAPGEKIALGGVSMGGYVALAFARRHPNLLSQLLLIDTRAEPDSPEAKANREKSIDAVKAHGVASFVEGMLPKVLGKTTQEKRPEVVELTRKIATGQNAEAVIAALKALRDRPDARTHLKNINIPTLVVVGEEDTVTPLDAAKVLAEGITGSKLVVIPEVGHLPNLEDAAKFNRCLIDFLIPQRS